MSLKKYISSETPKTQYFWRHDFYTPDVKREPIKPSKWHRTGKYVKVVPLTNHFHDFSILPLLFQVWLIVVLAITWPTDIGTPYYIFLFSVANIWYKTSLPNAWLGEKLQKSQKNVEILIDWMLSTDKTGQWRFLTKKDNLNSLSLKCAAKIYEWTTTPHGCQYNTNITLVASKGAKRTIKQ